ncbi:hypothetical protein Tco_1302789 [Tanacetum coccineum]
MQKNVKTAVQLQSDRLRDEAQAENEDFLNKLDDNIKKIIKDQVKEQVKAQVSKILPKIEKTVNEQLEAEVMTRSSTESKTSLAIAANLSELELKKILIEKMESNKSINRSNEQKNLYKALVEAYESDKLILDTYGDTVSFKRRRDDEDKDEEPSAGSNRGSKRRRARKEPESTSAPKEKTSKTTGKSTDGSKSQHKSAGESAHIEGPMHTDKELEEPTHQEFDIGATAEQSDEETTQHPDWFQKPAKIPTPDHDWNKTLPAVHGPVQPWLSNLAWESARDVYSKSRIIAVTKIQIIEWHGYKHLDRITVRRDDDKLYTFNKGDFKRLRLQDIEDMLILLVQGKMTNLNVEDRLAFGVSLRIFTRSIVIQRRVEDLQLAYSNPRGFIYLNKDKKNRLMRIDELYKFSDGTLDDVRTALNDQLIGIRMEYLPKIIWRQTDRERAKAMIQAIEKMLKSRRIMRSLEKFVGGRPYEERFNTLAGNPVKEILLKLNLPDHRSILTDLNVTPTKHGRITKPYSSPRFIANCFNARFLKMEVKDATLKLFKSTNQERYEHVGPEVTSSQDGKVNKMAKRDYAWLMISRCSRSHSRQAKEQAQDLKSTITTSNHKLMIEVKDYELKTKVEA